MYTLYGNGISQPSRSVQWFLELNNLPYKFQLVKIINGDNRTPEYHQKNPMGKVPVLKLPNEDTYISESMTILRYLAKKHGLSHQWLRDDDLNAEVQVDSYCHWHHIGLRVNCAMYIRAECIDPYVFGKEKNEKRVARLKKQAQEALKLLDRVYLRENGFMFGFTHPTIADLMAFEELSQMFMIQFDFSPYKNIARWIPNMKSLDKYDQIHGTLQKTIAKMKAKL